MKVDTRETNQVVKTGVVVSTKMDKTIIVEVHRKYRHPLYRKLVKKTRRYKAHDEYSKAHLGDEVVIGQTRPISKQKHWKLE